MPTFEISDEDRRAIRFAKSHRQTMCTRGEAREFVQDAVERALEDLRYRWTGAPRHRRNPNDATRLQSV